MGLDKSEIKRAVINELGASIEDALEQAKRNVYLSQGANIGLIQTIKNVEKLYHHVDRDVDEGKYNSCDGPLVVAKLVKGYIQRAVAVLESGAISYEQRRLMAEGAVKAYEQNVAMTKKLYDIESQKIEMIREVESEELQGSSSSNGRSGRRVTGIRPGATVKQRRMQEDLQSGSLTGETSPAPKKKVRRLASNGNNS